jgi:hypothetical protein
MKVKGLLAEFEDDDKYYTIAERNDRFFIDRWEGHHQSVWMDWAMVNVIDGQLHWLIRSLVISQSGIEKANQFMLRFLKIRIFL